APRIVGTGFSRRKNSVRSRAVPTFCRVFSHVSPAASRKFSGSFRVCIDAASGSSSINSSPFGLIIPLFRISQPVCVSGKRAKQLNKEQRNYNGRKTDQRSGEGQN